MENQKTWHAHEKRGNDIFCVLIPVFTRANSRTFWNNHSTPCFALFTHQKNPINVSIFSQFFGTWQSNGYIWILELLSKWRVSVWEEHIWCVFWLTIATSSFLGLLPKPKPLCPGQAEDFQVGSPLRPLSTFHTFNVPCISSYVFVSFMSIYIHTYIQYSIYIYRQPPGWETECTWTWVTELTPSEKTK